jgi:hypothetical protein
MLPKEIQQLLSMPGTVISSSYQPIEIYLGGPVMSLIAETPSYALQWRQVFFPKMLNTFLEEENIIDPPLFKFHNPCEGMSTKENSFSLNESNSFLYNSKFIFEKCIWQIERSSILLFNFLEDGGSSSLGSIWEAGLGYGTDKTIIYIIPEESEMRSHPMIEHSADFICPDLKTACRALLFSALKIQNSNESFI